jgi:alkylhydroperoxidase family enzyme
LHDPRDRAVYQFAAKVATDAASINQGDVDTLRAAGLGDADVVNVVYAAGARAFFTKVLDGLGVQVDPQNAQAFEGGLLASMIVGRPVPAL